MLFSTIQVCFGCIYVLIEWLVRSDSIAGGGSLSLVMVLRYIFPLPLLVYTFGVLVFVAALVYLFVCNW